MVEPRQSRPINSEGAHPSFPRRRESIHPCYGKIDLHRDALDSRLRGNDGLWQSWSTKGAVPLWQNQEQWRTGRRFAMVGAGRFELPTSWSQTRRPAAGPRPDTFEQKQMGNPYWYPRRGSNSRLRLRRPALYPLSYRGTVQ